MAHTIFTETPGLLWHDLRKQLQSHPSHQHQKVKLSRSSICITIVMIVFGSSRRGSLYGLPGVPIKHKLIFSRLNAKNLQPEKPKWRLQHQSFITLTFTLCFIHTSIMTGRAWKIVPRLKFNKNSAHSGGESYLENRRIGYEMSAGDVQAIQRSLKFVQNGRRKCVDAPLPFLHLRSRPFSLSSMYGVNHDIYNICGSTMSKMNTAAISD